MWQAHPDHSNFHLIDSTLLDKLMHEWMSIKATIQDTFQKLSSDSSYSSVQHPTEAFDRVSVALN
jgi:hypothetical protein